MEVFFIFYFIAKLWHLTGAILVYHVTCPKDPKLREVVVAKPEDNFLVKCSKYREVTKLFSKQTLHCVAVVTYPYLQF